MYRRRVDATSSIEAQLEAMYRRYIVDACTAHGAAHVAGQDGPCNKISGPAGMPALAWRWQLIFTNLPHP